MTATVTTGAEVSPAFLRSGKPFLAPGEPRATGAAVLTADIALVPLPQRKRRPWKWG
jgi:hypothetical protein